MMGDLLKYGFAKGLGVAVEYVVFSRLTPRRVRLPIRYAYHKVRGSLEQEMLNLRGLVSTTEVAIDVGANYGIWSYALSKLYRKVEAFEPNPVCAAELEASNIGNLNIHNVALSSLRGSAELHIPTAFGVPRAGLGTFNTVKGAQKTIKVPVERLDDYNFVGVSLIKIDVEGHELDVLKGAEATMLREKPVMVIEIEQRHLTFPMNIVFERVASYGFDGFFLSKHGLQPITELSYYNEYVYNFIFKPKDTLNKSGHSSIENSTVFGEIIDGPANICGLGIREQEAQDPPGDIPGAHGCSDPVGTDGRAHPSVLSQGGPRPSTI